MKLVFIASPNNPTGNLCRERDIVRLLRHDVIVVTTSYGHTIAIDPATGQLLWEYRPPASKRLEGTAQVSLNWMRPSLVYFTE